MNKNALKAKLWAVVDALEDSQGFVLVASSDEITFTHLHASAGWDADAMLDLEPLNEPEARKELARLGRINGELTKENAELQAQIQTGQRLLNQLQTAVAAALGMPGEQAA